MRSFNVFYIEKQEISFEIKMEGYEAFKDLVIEFTKTI
jgi:hypothetical protein